MRRPSKYHMFTLLWSLAVLPLMAQDSRLAGIKSVYIVPSDMRGTVKQLENRIPEKLGWKVVHDPKKADALIGITKSESVTGYWIYEGPGTVNVTTHLVGNVVHTTGTVSPGLTTVTTLKKRYGHVVIYDSRTADLLYNYTTRLWFIWSKLTGGFLKDVRKQVDRMSRVVADSASETAAADESKEPDFDFSQYATWDEFDGHAWNHIPESVKFGYLIGYIVALNRIEPEIGRVFEEANPSAGVSPLLAASRAERSKREKKKSVLEKQVLAVIESLQIQETPEQILVRLEEFYGDSHNLPVPVIKAILEIQDGESGRRASLSRP